jgi:hypothetical protein
MKLALITEYKTVRDEKQRLFITPHNVLTKLT